MMSVQGTPVCIALTQHGGQKSPLSLGVLDHVLGMHSLQTALQGLLTVINVSLEDGDGLQQLLQWVKTHSRC